MKPLRLLLWTVLLTLAALAGAFAYLPAYLQGHKDLLEAAATRALGRTVEIEGVGLEWWLTPSPRLSLALDGVRVHNPQWAQGPLLTRVDRVGGELDLGALLERRLAIEGLLIRGAHVFLERDAAGRDNWILSASGGGSGGLHVETVRVLDSTIAYRPALGETWTAVVSRLDLRGLTGPQPTLDADLAIRGSRLSLNASFGQMGGAPLRGWPFGIRAQVEGAGIEISGHATAPFDLSGLEADVRLKGPTPLPLGRLLGSEELPDGPFALDFRLRREGPRYRFDRISGSLRAEPLPGAVAVTGGQAAVTVDGGGWSAVLEGRVGELPVGLKLAPATGGIAAGGRRLAVTASIADSRFAGDLRLAADGARPRIEGDLQLGRVEPGAKQPRPSTDEQPGTRWSAAELPLSLLTKLDADLKVSAGSVTWQGVTATGVGFRALLDGGRLRFEGLTARLLGATVTGQASLDAGTQPPAVELALRADRVDLPRALVMLATAPKVGGTLDTLDLKARARGDTPAALIRSLGGAMTATAARVTRPGEKGRARLDIRLTKPTVSFQAGKAMRLKATMTLDQRAYDVDLTGGLLADLLLDNRPWPRVQVVARGKLREGLLRIEGDAGPVAAILAGRDLDLDLKLALGTVSGTLAGTLAQLDSLEGSRLKVEASGPDASQLAALLPLNLPAQRFKVSAGLQGRQGGIEVSDLKATLRDSDMAGDVRIRPGARPRLDAKLASRLLDLTPYLGTTTVGPNGAGKGASQPLPLEVLKAFDGELHLTAGHVRAGDLGIDDGLLDATLDDGHLVVSASAGRERMSADLDLRPQQDRWRFDLKHKGELDLSWLIEAENDRPLSDAPVTIDMRLSGLGDSMDTLLGSARGRADFIVGAGRIEKTASELPLGGFLLSLLSALNPVNVSQEIADLHCAVLQFDVADGIATSKRGIAVQTDNLNILGGGAVNLRTSEIELRFKATRRRGLGLSVLAIADRIVYITGTLQHPRAALDPTGLLVKGGAAWATSGLSLIYDQVAARLTASGNPCDTVLRRGGRD